MKHLPLYVLFAITALLVLLNRYSPLYISDYRIHFLVLFLAAATFVIIMGHRFDKLRTTKSIAIVFVIVGIACFLKAYLSWGGDWKTQTILYENVANSNKTINYQMRGDRFAFGYKKRVVEIKKIVPSIQWTTDIDTLLMNKTQWKKVDKQINELGLDLTTEL